MSTYPVDFNDLDFEEKEMESVKNRNPRKNHEGYSDPTAYEAIKKADEEYERFRKLLGCIYRICELAGFRVEERMVIKDMRTGRIWR